MKIFKRILLLLTVITFSCSDDDEMVSVLEGNIFFEESEVTVLRNSTNPFEVTVNFNGISTSQDLRVAYQITFPLLNPAVPGEDFQAQETQEFIIPRDRNSVSVALVKTILDNPDIRESRIFNIELLDVEGVTIGNPNTNEGQVLQVIILPQPTDPNDPEDFIGDKKFPVSINGDEFVIPYFSNVDDIMATDNPSITKAIIAVHGSGLNASGQLRNMMEAATIEGVSMENTLIIAPQFPGEDEVMEFNLDNQHIFWSGAWRSGSTANGPGDVNIPSFSVMDLLITKIIEYPNLQNIVLIGHSAGGQFANRYSMSSPVADDVELAGIDIRFIPVNPASYTYLDDRRLVSGTETTFERPEDLRGCYEFNEYRYGLEELFTYLDDVGAETIRERLAQRNVVYLVGENDNNPNFPGLDRGCEALFLGRHRLERGINYFNYLQFYYNDVFGIDINEAQEIDFVPRVGHTSFGMYTSEVGRSHIFRD